LEPGVPHILVIEDEPTIQLVIRKTLTRLGGYEVTVSENVTESLALARTGQIALVLMDVSLAHSEYAGELIDGLAFTRLLKADPATRAIPVLLVTAHARPGDAERLCAASGAEGYLAKPFAHPIELVEKVRAMLQPPGQPRPVTLEQG
jgi:CheY-like chemotaxis protein